MIQVLSSDYAACLHLLMKYPPVADMQFFINKALYIREPSVRIFGYSKSSCFASIINITWNHLIQYWHWVYEKLLFVTTGNRRTVCKTLYMLLWYMLCKLSDFRFLGLTCRTLLIFWILIIVELISTRLQVRLEYLVISSMNVNIVFMRSRNIQSL